MSSNINQFEDTFEWFLEYLQSLNMAVFNVKQIEG